MRTKHGTSPQHPSPVCSALGGTTRPSPRSGLVQMGNACLKATLIGQIPSGAVPALLLAALPFSAATDQAAAPLLSEVSAPLIQLCPAPQALAA